MTTDASAGDPHGPRHGLGFRAGRDDSLTRLVLAGVAANLAAGTLFGWSLVAQDIADGVDVSPAFAAGVFASAIVVFAVVLLVMGALQRRFAPRRLLTAAAGLGGAGLLLAATATGALVLWTGIALLFGTANGLGYGVAVGLAARAPQRRRGTATGLVVAAYAAGPVLLGLVAPAALSALGWRSCLAGLAVVVTALLGLAAWLAPARVAQRQRRGHGSARVPRRPVVLLWLIFACGTAPGLALFAQAVPLAADRHLGPDAAGLALSALALGNLAGRVAAGWWSDRIGRLAALATALGTGAAGVAGLAATTATPVGVAGFVGSGLAYGALSALVPATTADQVGPGAFPAAYGRVFTGWGVAGLLAPVAGARLLAMDGQHPAVLVLAAAPLVPAAMALLLLGKLGPG